MMYEQLSTLFLQPGGVFGYIGNGFFRDLAVSRGRAERLEGAGLFFFTVLRLKDEIPITTYVA